MYRKMANKINNQQMATQPETQSQNQSNIWPSSYLESQPIEDVVWGRLYAKNMRFSTLGIKRPNLRIEKSQTQYDLTKDIFRAERDEQNELCITTEHLPERVLCRVSKVHFQLEKNIKEKPEEERTPCYIHDLARNGTFVNGTKVGINKKRVLTNDDVISIAHPSFKAYQFKDLSPSIHGIPKDISSSYFISKQLGAGASGIVRLVYELETCKEYAMKHVQKYSLTQSNKPKILSDPERVMNEVKIMKSLDHPCVIKMHDIIDRTDAVFMVLELMKGGDLLHRIVERKNLSESISKLYFYQMCLAIKYLHEKGITHRDIKPDNILLESDEEDTLIKVSDFGLSKFVQKDSVMKTLCGTPLYVAPEVLKTMGKGSYTKKIDVWSLGVVLFTCLSGCLPFSNDYGSAATEQIQAGKFNFNHGSWKRVSMDAKNLIKKALTVDPSKRPSIHEILNDRWFKDRQMVRKAEAIMKITISTSDTENEEQNLMEPPLKRPRLDIRRNRQVK